MKSKERIPLHDHRDFNSGGRIAGGTIVAAVGGIGGSRGTGFSGVAEDLTTPTTDTALVLAPDGAGGVEFRAEMGGGVSEQPVAIVQRTSDWSTDSTANTPVEFDTEVKDTDGFYDAGDPERLTVPAEFDGMTAVLHGEAIWAAGTDYKEIKFLRNGDVDDPVAVMQVPGAATGNTGIALASRPIPVAAGDYFTMVLKSGSSDTALAHPGIDGDYSLIFSITIQAGGGGSSGRWELAVIPGSPPDSLYADGDWLYIFVP